MQLRFQLYSSVLEGKEADELSLSGYTVYLVCTECIHFVLFPNADNGKRESKTKSLVSN